MFINFQDVKKQLLWVKIKNIKSRDNIMNKNLLNTELTNKLYDFIGKNFHEFDELIDNIKLIDNFNIDVEEVKIEYDPSNECLVINIEDAFSDDEISEYNLLNDKFQDKLKELQFINKIYKCQKKCASENFNLPLAIKIKLLIDEIKNKIDCEKKAIEGINKVIISKEKDFASKINDFGSVLKTMRIENNIDYKKLSMMFGDDFLQAFKLKLIINEIVNFFNRNKKHSIEKFLDEKYIKGLFDKYPTLHDKIVKYVGTNC